MLLSSGLGGFFRIIKEEEDNLMQADRTALPKKKIKQPAWVRWLNIGIRTIHIGVAAILFGGVFFLVPFDTLVLWYRLTVLTGCVLLALEILHDPKWPHRGEGIMGITHICLTLGVYFIPSLRILLLCAILIVGCVGSHMPSNFRHWSIIHGPEKAD